MKQIYIVGNSRSGTTLTSRILGKHSQVFRFKELHFFEQMWIPTHPPEKLTEKQSLAMLGRLISMQRDGYYTPQKSSVYHDEAQQIYAQLTSDATAPVLFENFLTHLTEQSDKIIACTQTPRNLYYAADILNLYPEAVVVNLIRDGRDIVLSQKSKWKKVFGDTPPPWRETVRRWANYHPLTISLLWNSAVNAIEPFKDHPRVLTIYFEQLVNNPEKLIPEICEFVGLDFEPEMLDIERRGSSFPRETQQEKGMDKETIARWQKYPSIDVLICQWMSGKQLSQHGYELAKIRLNPIALLGAILSFPVKISLAFLLNIGRFQNIFRSIRQRLFKPVHHVSQRID